MERSVDLSHGWIGEFWERDEKKASVKSKCSRQDRVCQWKFLTFQTHCSESQHGSYEHKRGNNVDIDSAIVSKFMQNIFIVRMHLVQYL